ncbi:mannose-P-dolichol utilization defect 1, partial [Phenoliferia sp. Uapishka_3]
MEHVKLLTHNIPQFVRDPLVALIGQECYTTLIYNVDLTSSNCIKYSVSKVLGLGIVAGGAIVKLPQILKIVGGKSARGLSLSSYVLDTAGLFITVAYNFRHGFPWSTYGESVFLLAQNVVITFLIITFSSSNSRALLLTAFTSVSLLSTYALLSPSLSLPTLQFLAALCIPLSLLSKLPQILSNFSAGSTGQLSAFLVFNSLAGCLARVFTTATETGDPVLWWGFVLAAALNAVLAVQMGLYWKGDEEKVRLTKGNKELKRETVVPVKTEEIKEKEEVKLVASTPVKMSASPSTTPKRYVRKLD